MVVTCISKEIKSDLRKWADGRAQTWRALDKFDAGLLGLKRQDFMDTWKPMVRDTIGFYDDIRTEFTEKCPTCGSGEKPQEGTIRCLPSGVKSDVSRFLNTKAKRYPYAATELEAQELADTLKNMVANCTSGNRPSNTWLKKRGATKDDLVLKGNILQLDLF